MPYDRTYAYSFFPPLQIEYDDRAKQSLKPQQQPPAQKPAVVNDDSVDEDDFDIDAI